MKLNTVNLYPKINTNHLTFTPTNLNQFQHANIMHPRITRNAPDKIEFEYDIHERISKVTNKNHTLEFEYNITSQCNLQVQDNIRVSWIEKAELHAEYRTYLNHTLEDRQYTKERNRTLILDNQDPISLSYDYKERTQTIIYPNGLKEEYLFDIDKSIKEIRTAHQIFKYERDVLGRITKLNDTIYKYDTLGRLTIAGKTKFKYDKAGNNKYHQAIYNMQTYQLIENRFFTYEYDKRGNLKSKINKQSKEEKHYGFNQFNQLEEYLVMDKDYNQIKKIVYTYDGLNRRISKNEDGVLRYYLYNKENIIAILDENRNELATIVHHPTRTDTPLSITTKEGTFYYHRDHQGSIIALSDKDGKIVEFIEYDGHYGAILNHTKLLETHNPYGYTGREMDTNDLYYYRARYYDPFVGRFLSLDPIRLESGDFNFYRYVKNDPINFIDPSGLIMAGGGIPTGISGVIHPPVKPGVLTKPNTYIDMCSNSREAKDMSIFEFINAVKTGGKWDYKKGNSQYENFGNYHFGYITAAKYPEFIAKAGAGGYQILSQTSSPSFWNSWFDDPKDQYWIERGYKDYVQNKYNCPCIIIESMDNHTTKPSNNISF